MTRKATPKKITVLLASCCLLFASIGQASMQAATPDSKNENAAATNEQPAEATSDPSDKNNQDKDTDKADQKESAGAPSPQVAKLIALYPRLVARIAPLGKVCFDGEECDINITVLSASADGGPRDGATIYKAICQTCHATGLIGAPKYGNAGDWNARIAKGKDTLYNHAINGFNAMPAKGGADIPDEEVKNAVDYMVAGVN